jgi:hypothetical protein
MRAILWIAALAITPAAAATTSEGHGDLRGGVSVGMAVAELPKGGYKDFACVAPKDKALSGFADYETCDSGADGLRPMRVVIDEPGEDESLVAGHPVDLTLSFDDRGRLARIVIVTKSKGPMFIRKKAFLLGLQARARYGVEGWDCKELPLAADEEPLGPTSVKEHCEKTTGERKLIVDRSLYRRVGADVKSFTSESHVIINWASK